MYFALRRVYVIFAFIYKKNSFFDTLTMFIEAVLFFSGILVILVESAELRYLDDGSNKKIDRRH